MRGTCLLLLLVIPALAADYKPPKTSWGDPDLQGTWTSDDTRGVPMERPANFGERRYLTGQERLYNPGNNASPARAQAEALAEGKTVTNAGNGRGVDIAPAPSHWVEAARRASRATSQVIDPPDGRIPA